MNEHSRNQPHMDIADISEKIIMKKQKKIDNEEVVERVMRMGLEGWAYPLEKLFDLARKQLNYKKEPSMQSDDFHTWKRSDPIQNGRKFAFVDGNKPTILDFTHQNVDHLTFVRWHAKHIPIVTIG